MPVLDLDDQSEHARGLAVDPKGGHRVANPTQLVAVRIEDADPGQARQEHA